jgi:hypothetical protein
MLWRQFYTEPRPYFIHGRKQYMNLSELLRTIKFKDSSGEEKEEEIVKFDITVRPNSNFPNRWENTFDFLIQLIEIKDAPENLKQALWFMVFDLLADRFPELEMDGEYLKMGKATQIGMQEMEKQQQEEEQKQKDRDSIKKKLQGQALNMILKNKNGGGNGKPEATPAQQEKQAVDQTEPELQPTA